MLVSGVVFSQSSKLLEKRFSDAKYISKPNGGLGFFEVDNEMVITEIGTEQVMNSGTELITTKPNTLVEAMSVLANNAYCGAIQ